MNSRVFGGVQVRPLDGGMLRVATGPRKVMGFISRRVKLSITPCLLQTGERRVLVDCGIDPRLLAGQDGLQWSPPPRSLEQQLSEAGCPAAQVTDVVLSHLHLDHSGGLLGAEAPRFPAARVHLQRQALETAVDNQVLRHPPAVLEFLRRWPLLELHDGDWILEQTVICRLTGGHAPGHQVTLVGRSGAGADELLLCSADLLPTRIAFQPRLEVRSDWQPERAAELRAEYRALAGELTYFLYHAPSGERFFRPERV